MSDIAALLARDWYDEYGNRLCRHGQVIVERHVETSCLTCRAEDTR